MLVWEELESWYTPTDNFFYVTHYGIPMLNESEHTLGLAGLVARPRTFTLEDLKALPRHEVDFTLECSGNTGTGLDFFIGGIGNARWAGARLAPLLEHAGPLDEASEVIFWGADSGTVTIRDNSGIVSAGQTGVGTPDGEGGIDLTITEQFARSMSLRDALARDNLLCYEMNGDPLPPEHGFPLRLIAPGWYGVANVKWLTRIEVVDRRFAGRFMARDYVSIREETRNGDTALDVRDRRPRPPQVRAREGHAPRRRLHRLGRRVGRAHRGRGSARGRWPVERGGAAGSADAARTLARLLRGRSGSSPGACRRRANIASRRARSTPRATCSRRPTIRSSRAGGPTGRATATSRASSRSRDTRPRAIVSSSVSDLPA